MSAASSNYLVAGCDLADRYAELLGAYCIRRDEGALVQVYDIAREALNDQMSLADYGSMHHGALGAICRSTSLGERAIEAADDFFLEGIAVYDMALRGYQTTVSRLQGEIAERRRVEEELRDITFDLARQRDDLDNQVRLRTVEIRERAKALEQTNGMLRQANREQAEFTYALSHDLKTPINTIDMFLQTLLEDFEDVIDDEALELIHIASETADRMKQLIDDVLEYSRVVDHTFQAEAVDLSRLIEEITVDQQSAFAAAEAELVVGDLPMVRGNQFQLRVLMTNLLSNALKYRAKDRKPQIRVHAEQDPEGLKVCVAVSDNGIGIREDRQAHIFELFKRLHTFDEFEGSGIGLALCKRVAENHGTEISVTSEEGAGSVFSIWLDLDGARE